MTRRYLPDTVPGVKYIIPQGKVVYVGQSRTVRARIGTHISEGVKSFDAITVIECPHGELLSRERRFIRMLAPRYNDCAVGRMAKRPKDLARTWLNQHR